MAEQSVSTSVKVRFPREMLAGIETWAAERHLSRSKAVRVLLYRGLAGDWGNWKCTCDSLTQCTGDCDRQ